MSLHYSGLIICSLCVGKRLPMETGSSPKGGPAQAETKVLPLVPRHWRPHSFLWSMVVIWFRTEPNLLITGMLAKGYLFIFFYSWVKPGKAAQPWEAARSIIISSMGGWRLEQLGPEYCDSRQMQTDWHVLQAGTSRLRGTGNAHGSLGY